MIDSHEPELVTFECAVESIPPGGPATRIARVPGDDLDAATPNEIVTFECTPAATVPPDRQPGAASR